MHRRPFVLALTAALAALAVPRSLADTTLTVPQSPLVFLRLDLKVEGPGKRTFLLYPEPSVTVTLGATPPRFEYMGHLLSADRDATGFQSMFVGLASPLSKVDEVKGKYALKYSSAKDASSGIFAFLDVLITNVNASLPVAWLGNPVATEAAKMNGKAKRSRDGQTWSGKIKVSFSGRTFLGAPVKGKLTIAFAQAPAVI